jgi:hypothetical protein
MGAQVTETLSIMLNVKKPGHVKQRLFLMKSQVYFDQGLLLG